LFPTLSALAANGDMDGYKQRLSEAIRGVLFLAFPATVGLILLGAPAIRILLEYGRWDESSTAPTAWALALYAIGIAGHSLLEVLSRAFYALADTWTPVLIGIVSIVANVILSLLLIRVIGDPTSLQNGTFGGIALANSVATLIEGAALWMILSRRVGGIRDGVILRGVIRSIGAAIGMGAAISLMLMLLRDSSALVIAAVSAGIGGIVYFGLAFLFGINEARTIPQVILRRLRR